MAEVRLTPKGGATRTRPQGTGIPSCPAPVDPGEVPRRGPRHECGRPDTRTV